MKKIRTLWNQIARITFGCCMLATSGLIVCAEDVQEMEELVVTATKITKEKAYVIDSVSLIGEQEIMDKDITDITEVFRFTPGMEFKQAGGPGQLSYPKMRGLGSGHFLVIIDGMKITEGMSGGVGALLGQLDPEIIERIEILRGPQSALYGSDTTAGIISITTKGGMAKPLLRLGAEYGSLEWKKGYGSYRGSKGNFGYGLTMAYTDSGGVHDKEYYKNLSPHIKLSYKTDDFEAIASFLYMKTEFNFAELVECYSTCSDRSEFWAFQLVDPNQNRRTDQYLSTLNLKQNLTDNLRHKVVLGWYRKKWKNNDENDGFLGYITAPTDNFTVDYVNYYNKGETVPVYDDGTGKASYIRNDNKLVDYNFIWDSALGNIANNTLLLGAEYFRQEGEKWGKYGNADATKDNYSFYANNQVLALNDALVLSGGVRRDHHQEYGNKITGKGGAAYTFQSLGTTFFGNYGTSFKAPTFANLYDPKYGNDDLEPENGWTGEGGVRQELFEKKVDIEATYWHTKLDNIIAYDYKREGPSGHIGSYVNRDKAHTEGVEFAAGYQITKDMQLSGNYTYCDSYSEKNGKEYRTPQIAYNKFNIDLFYKLMEKYFFNIHTYYSGPRLRWKGDIEMDGYVRVDVSARVKKVWKDFTLFGRVENLFDDKTEEGLGYEQPGIYGIVGLELEFGG